MTATTTPSAAAQAVTLLREHLAEQGGGAIERTEITPLFGDASTRRYFRLRAGGESAIAAVYPEPFDPERMPFLEVRALLEGYGLPVPKVRRVDAARGLLVLEDLGDVTLQEALREVTARVREDLYREALDQLARLHREAEKGPRSASCFQVAFDIEKLSWELHYFLKHFVEGLRGGGSHRGRPGDPGGSRPSLV